MIYQSNKQAEYKLNTQINTDFNQEKSQTWLKHWLLNNHVSLLTIINDENLIF